MADLETSESSNSTGSADRSPVSDPYIGYLLDNRYEIVQLLGSGGWGNVYRATDTNLGIDVAVKIVHKHHMLDEPAVKRFEMEAVTLSRVNNSYVIRITDHGFSPAPYIVMEHFEGTPLNRWLKDNGAMQVQLAIELFLQLCEGLRAAESLRIVHRDLKPANILLKITGSTMQAKILDFGLAKFIDESSGAERLTSTGEILGSPPYMSPEQWKGDCDNRSDIYSLGCIMYEVLSGRPAFTAQFGMEYMSKHFAEKPARISSSSLSMKLSPALENIVSKCMQKSPINRYQSIDACAADLKKVRSGQTPRIFVPEEVIAKNFKSLVILGYLTLSLAVVAYLLKEPIIHVLSRQLYAVANSQLSKGQTGEAISSYQQIVAMSQALPDKDLQKLPALRALEAFYKERKDLNRAETFEKKIDGLLGRINSSPEMAMFTYNVQRQFDKNNLAEAEKLGKIGLALANSRLGKRSMSSAACLHFLGQIAYRQGAFQESVDYYKQSLSVAEELLEPTNFRKAAIMDHLSLSLKAAGQAEESEKYSRLAQDLMTASKKTKCLTVKIPTAKDDLILWDLPAN